MDNHYCTNSTSQIFTVEVQCCITGYDTQVTDAIIDCDGNLHQGGSVEIIPVTAGNCTQYDLTANGLNQNTVSNLNPGTQEIELVLNNQIPISETVTINTSPLDNSYLNVIVNKQNSSGTCTSDNCTGSIYLITIGGNGNYYYDWSDCMNIEALTTGDAPPSITYCDGPNATTRQNLCSGMYTVTITDQDTGCSVTKNINILLAGSSGTINPAELEPSLSIYPVVYDSNTTITYDIKEDAEVSLKVYNTFGQPVETLVNSESRTAGTYTFQHNNQLNTGVYIYHLQVCDKQRGKLGVKID